MSTITTIAASDLITDSRAVINTNFSNLNTDKFESSNIDTDTSLAANSDTKVASQKATKAYVDTLGNVNASTTARGIVEEATSAEMIAGTAAGGTGARLFLNPSLVAETGTDKIVKTKSTGLLDASIIPSTAVDKIEVDATEVTVGNTATETTIFDCTIPGGTLSTNNAVRLKIFVSNFNETNSGTFAVRLKYGGTTIATADNGGNSFGTNVTGLKGWIEGYLVADGSTSAQKGVIRYEFAADSAEENTRAAVGISKVFATGNGTATQVSTGDLTMTVTIQNSGTSANDSFTAEFWVVEKII